MREVPIAENRAAIDFANRVMTGQIDIVIFMTGVGVRHLIAEVERHVDRGRFLAALSDVTTVARGPKPVAVLKELGLEPTVRVPEPNTWREVLATIDMLRAAWPSRTSACWNTAGRTPASSPGSKPAAPGSSRSGSIAGTSRRRRPR